MVVGGLYDLANPANAYLGGQTYALANGGSIAPVPEPAIATIFLALAPLAPLAPLAAARPPRRSRRER